MNSGTPDGANGADGMDVTDGMASHVDTTKPNVARFYDLLLGGKDNYEVDREIYRRTLEISPEAPLLARAVVRISSRRGRSRRPRSGQDRAITAASSAPIRVAD